jgi:hypothetical protein
VSPRWHAGCGRTKPEHRHRCQLTVIGATGRLAPIRRVRLRELVGEALGDAREFSLPGPCPRLPGLNREYGRAGTPYAPPATLAFARDPGTDTPGHCLPPSRHSTTYSNNRMTTVVQSIGCPVPHRRAPLMEAYRPGGTGWGQPLPPRPHRTPMSTLRSSATAPTLSHHTRPTQVRPDTPGTGFAQSAAKGKTGGPDTPHRPGLPSSCGRAAS